jgi:hypothetical protein
MFTPYMDVFEDYSAKPMGQKQYEGQEYMGAVPVGDKVKNTSSLIPGGFSGGYTIPGTSDYSFSHLGMANMGVPLQNQTTGTLNPYGVNYNLTAPPGNQITGNLLNNNPLMMGNNLNPPDTFMGQKVERSLLRLPQITVEEDCKDLKKLSLKIASEILKEEYHEIYKEINNYLLKNKFIIGMTEIKMTRNLRKKIAGIMQMFSNITPENIKFSNDEFETLRDIKQHNYDDLLEQNDFVEEDDMDQPKVDEYVDKI